MSCIPGDERIKVKMVNGELDTTDICELLGITKATVYHYVNTGELKACENLPNQRKKFTIEDFKKFLISKPKYYLMVYGEEQPVVEPPVENEVMEEPVKEPKKEMDVISELFNKLEAIEAEINRSKVELAKLEAQRDALEEVIDMF